MAHKLILLLRFLDEMIRSLDAARCHVHCALGCLGSGMPIWSFYCCSRENEWWLNSQECKWLGMTGETWDPPDPYFMESVTIYPDDIPWCMFRNPSHGKTQVGTRLGLKSENNGFPSWFPHWDKPLNLFGSQCFHRKMDSFIHSLQKTLYRRSSDCSLLVELLPIWIDWDKSGKVS